LADSNSPDQAEPGIQFTDQIIRNKRISIAIFNFACWQVFFVTLCALLGLVFTDDKKTYLYYALFFFFIGACIFYTLNMR